MKEKQKQAIIYVVVALVVLVAIFFFSSKAETSGEYDVEAQCITEKGVLMYGAWWCPHCQNQKEEFGKSFEYINYIECAVGRASNGQTKECTDAGIKTYPTWKFPDGTVLEGEMSPNTLAEKAGCEI